MIHELLQEAGRAELQLAYKLLKALLRSVGRWSGMRPKQCPEASRQASTRASA
jgi:hypothetical protein